jgi:hypothetical protein
VLSKSRIFKFLKRDCGTIPVAEITSGKIEIFSKHQRFLIATDSSKYLLIFVLYVCVILCEFGTAISKRYACFCCYYKLRHLFQQQVLNTNLCILFRKKIIANWIIFTWFMAVNQMIVSVPYAD